MNLAPSNCNRGRKARAAFSLVEVIVAIGILAVTVVAVIGMSAALGQRAATINARGQAIALADAIENELERIRDVLPKAAGSSALDALAALAPENTSEQSLRLVAANDGLRVAREDEDDPAFRVPPAAQYFLVEVRQQSGPLAYGESGFLALAVTIRWPYRGMVGADSAHVSLNLCIGP